MDFLLHHTPLLYFTQSFWRDEAFSVLLATKPLATVFHNTSEPPFYYILLHIWINLFGSSEIAVRSLSFIGFLLAIGIIVKWGVKLFRNHWLSWYLPLLFFVNPMLLYYAFEARAYGWYIFFTVASLYTYMEQKWVWYVASTTLGLYTHTYMIFVPIVELLHYVFIHKKVFHFYSLKKIVSDVMIRSVFVVAALFTPWIAKIISELPRLQKSWYFPVDAHLVKSVVANIFFGFEGTPDFLWTTTAKLSYILAAIFIYALLTKKHIMRNSLFFLITFLPLIIIIGISFYKPLFVNRYLIPSTIGEIFLIVFALENIPNRHVQKILAASILIGVSWFNIWYPTYNKKMDIRSTITQINSLKSSQDIVLVEDALTLYEALYYSQDKSRVFWHNPEAYPFPWYIGDVIFSPTQVTRDLPNYPTRAFLVHLNGSFEMVYSLPIKSTISTPSNKSK